MVPDLVTCEWLANHLYDPGLRVVDVRWYLIDTARNGRQEYLAGHIPGAVFSDVDHDLAASFGQGPGRHPIPNADAFAEAMARLGIGDETYVIAYDDNGGANAARLWWLLRYYGHDQVSLLDGGIVEWKKGGEPLERGETTYPRAQFTPQAPRREWVANKETVGKLAQDSNAVVMDVRARERYRGEVEPIDPRAGHVPGARSAPYAENWRAPDDPRFLPPDQLRARFEALGVRDAEHTVSYCGSGINGSLNVFVLHMAGMGDTLLYEGSWSDWSRDPQLPAATGPNP